jgi:hypothetical protein
MYIHISKCKNDKIKFKKKEIQLWPTSHQDKEGIKTTTKTQQFEPILAPKGPSPNTTIVGYNFNIQTARDIIQSTTKCNFMSCFTVLVCFGQ